MSAPQLMLVPGGTSPGAVTMTYSAIHKLWEFYEREEKTGQRRGQWIVVAPRPADECLPHRLAASNAAFQSRLHHLPAEVDVIVQTSGSASGSGRLVGLTTSALVASARATHEVLGGAGRWIVALPVHHVAGLQTLMRSCVAGTSPVVADMSEGFDAAALLRACVTARTSSAATERVYLSLVEYQLRRALQVGGELVGELAQLDAILVGGSAIDSLLIEQARDLGLKPVVTYGMSETSGGCVYDGIALPGMSVSVGDDQRIEISGPTLLVDYLDRVSVPSDRPLFWRDGQRWLRTNDRGTLSPSGVLTVLGRSDDVIISGALNICPATVVDALMRPLEPGRSHQAGRAMALELPPPLIAPLIDVAVVGLPDSTWGQVCAALVVVDDLPQADFPSYAAALRDRVGAVLGRASAPRLIARANRIPRTALGKPDTVQVRRMIEAERDEHRAWQC